MATRRTFLTYTGATTLTLYGFDQFGVKRAYAASIPGGTLDPGAVNKFVTPLLIPPVMPMSTRLMQPGGKNVDYYEISVKQFQQQILPAGLPATTVWGYGAVSAVRGGLLLHHAPSLTIEAQYDRPVRIKWINDLKDAAGNYRPHLLPVDQTLHWANPPGGTDRRDTRPTFGTTPERYTGPVPIVTHVHGAVGVGDESDGYAEAWYLPAAGNIPSGYATQGTWYDFFKNKAAAKFGVNWGLGFATFQYPNLGRAAQDWYHDHTLGMTRLNVYAGPAGFYLLRGGPQGDDAVKDRRTGAIAVLPGPAPNANDKFPSNKSYYEIPIAVQDRSFNADGSLFYPDSRAFFDGIIGPYVPHTDISPTWNPEFFGNMIMVNGTTWPFLTVEARRYRLRFLNGCQSRFLILDFGSVPGVEVWQIANDGGFLAAPVNLTAAHQNRVLMSPAERADLIVDFTSVPLGTYVLGNLGPDEPYGGGAPGSDFSASDPATTGQILQFRIVPSVAADLTTPPQFLTLPPVAQLPAATVTRKLALIEEMSMYFEDAPAEARLGTVSAGGELTPLKWVDAVTENPSVGAVEIWELYNTTGDAHPIHVHEVKFQVLNRQPITVDETARTVIVNGPVRGAEPWESGFKDTMISYPGEVTRIRAQFVNPGQYVWHCHIVEHEDNEMMRPYRIGPLQPGEPPTLIASLETQSAAGTWRLLRRRHGKH
jgi:FtsP/CotA-like multicopper oxidase with cupredoxin domain